MSDDGGYELTPLELASGVVTGRTRSSQAHRRMANPFAALEESVLPALRRPPCLVSFSGGMDSSFVLAIAAHVARREGLALPVPITWRFTGAPRAEESLWQERVVAAASVDDWQLLQAVDDLDLIGPVAQRLLTRYGVLHPANLHLHLPLIEAATGGSLLTGLGGDQILTGWRRPQRASITRALRAQVPGRVVALTRQRNGEDCFPWLHPAVSRRVFRTHRQELGAEPHRVDRRMAWHAQRRDLLMARSNYTAVGADNDVAVIHPLVDPNFLAALRLQVRGAGRLTRSQLMCGIADGALPDVATAKRPKAHFLEVFLRAPTREFVRTWDGTGADESLVNVDALRELWSHWPIPGATAGLVQQLWLSALTRTSPLQEARL